MHLLPNKAHSASVLQNSKSYLNRVYSAEESSQQIVADANKVVKNVAAGLCPIELEKVFIFVSNTKKINEKGAIKILCNYDTPEMLERNDGAIVTQDALILMRVCTGNDASVGVEGFKLGCAGDDLLALRDSSEYANPESAVSAFINLAIQRGFCSEEDVDRLTKKYKFWFRHRTWKNCDSPVSFSSVDLSCLFTSRYYGNTQRF